MVLHLPGPPVAYPLKNLEQLADRSFVDYAVMRCSVPLALADKPNRPRLLVCHDFKGGYQDDKWIQGNDNGDAYSIWHWDLIDVFVYFSHNLVTLPPPGWTNAAHKHGVQVLGTLITEWREGAELCRTLLQSPESVQIYASRLAELAYDLGFDGWLINIENQIDGYQMNLLLEFIQLVTGMMHSMVPGSLVIWYDAVTIQGQLVWQNCLNGLNKPFFDLCDGIFTNYSWMIDSPRNSAKVAGDRAFDVYMGVDVFGRKTFGGGGFQTDLALQVARASGVSAAIFAPGWVYETGQGPNFHSAQDRWWGSIKACWPRARHNPVKLPFFSNFDQGIGCSVYVGGHRVSRSPWSNLSCQNLQVLFDTLQNPVNNRLEVFVSQQESVYSGGSCVKISGTLPIEDMAIINLYHSSFQIPKGHLHVSYSVALEPSSQLTLALEVEFISGRKVTFFLTEPGLQNLSLVNPKDHLNFVVKAPANSTDYLVGKQPASDGNSWTVREYVLEMGACEVTHIHALIHGEDSYHTALKKKYEHLLSAPPASEASEGEASATTGDDESYSKLGSEISYSGLLGHIRVATWPEADCSTTAADCSITAAPCDLLTGRNQSYLSIDLVWKFGDQTHSKTQGCELEHCKVYSWEDTSVNDLEVPSVAAGDHRFLGVAKVNCFFVHQLQTRPGCKRVGFVVQRFCVCGGWEDLNKAPKVTVDVPFK